MRSITATFALLALTLCFPTIVDAQSCSFDRLLIREIRKTLESRPAAGSSSNELLTVTHQISNSRLAQGVALKGRGDGSNNFGFILAFPGNAQTARELLNGMRTAAGAGFDVFVFDYTNLTGNAPLPRLHELVSDAKELVSTYIQDDKYKGKINILYGVSTGGIVLAQAVPPNLPGSTRVVLDSVPDRIPTMLWCDSQLNPSNAVAAMTPQRGTLLILNGENDQKVIPANSRTIAELAEKKGGCHTIIQKAAHPFEPDDNAAVRVGTIVAFAKDQACKAK